MQPLAAVQSRPRVVELKSASAPTVARRTAAKPAILDDGLKLTGAAKLMLAAGAVGGAIFLSKNALLMCAGQAIAGTPGLLAGAGIGLALDCAATWGNVKVAAGTGLLCLAIGGFGAAYGLPAIGAIAALGAFTGGMMAAPVCALLMIAEKNRSTQAPGQTAAT